MTELIAETSKHPDIIVIGASAGGVEAILELIPQIPADIQAAIFVVVHVPARSESKLPPLLGGRSNVIVKHAVHKEPIRYGHVYIAPPDHHMMIERKKILLSKGPKENMVRPAIDPLFRTAAENYNRRVIGVILTGTLDDGTAGMIAVRKYGGIRVVQDPPTALFDQMPRNALEKAGADFITPLPQIASLLVQLVQTPKQLYPAMAADHDRATEMVRRDINQQERGGRDGMTSTYTCPDCGGVLWEADEEGLLRFRCHTGHAFTADTLYSAQDEMVEEALWSAVRSLTENGILAKQLAIRMRDQGNLYSADRFDEKATTLERHIDRLRHLILGNTAETDEPSVGP